MTRFISLFTVLFLAIHFQGHSQINSMVFKGGTEGHKIYRIPAIISLPNQELLAFAEGRVNGSDDYGDVNLVLKRSKDFGKTWSSLEILVDYDSLQAGNPAPVLDRFDPNYPDGVVYLFYNTGNNHEYDIRMGRGVREVWMMKSYDLGKTWEEPQNITLQTHKPNIPSFNPDYNFPEDWRHYANTPGHAFQFQEGKYKGRIFVSANHSKGDPQEGFTEYQAHGFFTDDHGKTFKISESVEIPGSNESIAAELPNDRMIMSVRNQKGDIRQRILAYSSDGGKTWDEAYFEEQLPDPVCQGSIISITDSKGIFTLIHSNNSDPVHRNNLSLKFSDDLGKTWSKPHLIDGVADPGNSSYTGYSDLVEISNNTVGIIYEKNDYTEIVFKTISW
ncbi:exo-alpha-sialidase [Algoriphagus lutimaris]|uniref:sialidase family protein n=1 Tax=Algoriphagus lutimaris TaxID=613197 RepID=UPI00196A3BF9|nr:sialidase family protein [Algoriphagus lutimaris]MBN3520262.1 exo-alpha-sialidase [Algoriphagus lutimaris]